MTEARKLIDAELKDHLQNKGVQQELNRTMLHPIGLELRINDENEIEIWKTEDPKGFVFDRINKMQQKIFTEMNVAKQSKRQSLLGFGIQVWDLYRSSKLNDLGRLAIPPQKVKIKLIARCLDTFTQVVYQKILMKHAVKDDNFDIDQFEYRELLTSLLENLEAKDWIDVSAFAMLIHQKETLKAGMYEVQRAAKDYEQMEEEKNEQV